MATDHVPESTDGEQPAGDDAARPVADDGPGAGGSGQHASAGTTFHGPRRPATSLLTFGTVALVLVIVVVLVAIKVTGNSTVSTISTPVTPTPAPPAVVQAVTHIPASVYNSVGIGSSVAAVSPPSILSGQPALTDGVEPEVVFVGNESCPYCAAERWALVAALSRFGTFTRMNQLKSAAGEAFPGTPTFTFFGSRYRSPHLHATLVEHFGLQRNDKGTGFAVLERIPRSVRSLMASDDPSPPGASGPLVPFIDIGGQAVVAGGSFSPSILQQLSATQIATGLKDPNDPATQAIVATANYLSAVLCAADGDRPLHVCASAGVGAALTDLGIGP